MGAYGLQLGEVEGTLLPLLQEVPSVWPRLHLSVRSGASLPPSPIQSSDIGVHRLVGGGQLVVRRSSSNAELWFPSEVDPEQITHPFLAAAAGALAPACGYGAFHGGAVVIEGTCWGVLGDAMAGKSSLIGALWYLGAKLLADDLIVTDGKDAFVGPRCFDLRDPPKRDIPYRRSADKFRVLVDPMDSASRLGGWIHLGWGETVEVQKMDPAENLRRLLQQGSGTASLMLDLATLPAFRFVRPRCLEVLDGGASTLLVELRKMPLKEGSS